MKAIENGDFPVRYVAVYQKGNSAVGHSPTGFNGIIGSPQVYAIWIVSVPHFDGKHGSFHRFELVNIRSTFAFRTVLNLGPWSKVWHPKPVEDYVRYTPYGGSLKQGYPQIIHFRFGFSMRLIIHFWVSKPPLGNLHMGTPDQIVIQDWTRIRGLFSMRGRGLLFWVMFFWRP